MQIDLDRNSARLGQQICEQLEDTYRTVLIENNKVATRRVFNSIRCTPLPFRSGIAAQVFADIGLRFIESGKRANTKLPVRQVNGEFRLVERLEEWADEILGQDRSDYLLARSIARRSRAGVDITGEVLRRVTPRIRELIAAYVLDESRVQIAGFFRQGLRA